VTYVQPWAVDVATGVESASGRKDPVKLRAFVANAKSVEFDLPEVLEGERPYDWRLDD
jgi:phosphoribosylanthranilate isomerase